MAKAITVRFAGPTESKPGRYIVSDGDGNRLVISKNDLPGRKAGRPISSWADAAATFCKRMGWAGRLHEGGTATGWVFVFENSKPTVVNQAEGE